MRTYEQTHKWISFKADFRPAPVDLWLLLGECQSKCEHIANVALKPQTAEKLLLLSLAKGVAATTAIEGNTLTEEQVKQVIDKKLQLPPSQQYLQQEVENIVSGCNLILNELRVGKLSPLDRGRIEKLNEIILKDLPLNDKETVPGKIRNHSVVVGPYKAVPAEDCEYLLDKLCEWLNGSDFTPKPNTKIIYAILKAVIAHLYLAWIHPFGDGNGRTARLIELQILISSGVPSPAAHLLSNHYNQTRSAYYQQLDKASKSGGDIIPFVIYAVAGFRDGLKSQLDQIFVQQLETTWENYVHEKFKDKDGPSDARQRKLVLDLTKQTKPTPKSELTSISPRIAAAYALKTPKTLSRDVNVLLEMKLIKKVPDGYKPNTELMMSFFPERARS